jgi:type IV pilus assembly protein PilV
MNNQRGATLIEVMITVLILATGLLTMAALQNRSLQNNHSSYMRSQANVFAYDLIDRVRVASTVAAVVTPGTAEINSVVSSLPNGAGNVACTAARVCTITITWAEQDGSDASGDTSTFTYVSRI